ncbi:hypothetical protein DYB28_008485 [Aphanomyces astaci]|uniref:Uncharacterized protein n=3 Tax=Aphanomyces astaci TaxID=112090 RepID=A0A397BRS1_APHAT|nr:hypothetical protein DYB25_006946 [Aphanomyces astaci]RLO00744.1 hypothetical protein DYB28_008485 [Aphanomyces astaci]
MKNQGKRPTVPTGIILMGKLLEPLGHQASLGLTLAYFHHFIDIHGGRDAFESLATIDVCARFVVPCTSVSRLSLVDQVERDGDSDYVKPAEWLISHAWSYKFLDVVDAMDNFCDEQGLSHDTSFWFCMFANNQHTIGSPSEMVERWLAAFRTALTDTGKIVMVLVPWRDPEALKRTWCVYEVYLSVVLNARFEVAMTKAQKRVFLGEVQHRSSEVLQMMSQVSSKHSITTIASDRDHIFGLIEAQVGFDELDRMVFNTLQTWVFHAFDSQRSIAMQPRERFDWLRSKASALITLGSLTQAEVLLDKAVDIFRRDLPPATPEGWEAMVDLGQMRALKRYPSDTWVPLFVEGLPKLQQLLGPHHPTTLDSTKNIGRWYCRNHMYDRGMPLLRTCLSIEQQKMGDDAEAMVLETKYCLGEALYVQDQVVEAQALFAQVYEGMCRLFGPAHPLSKGAQSNFATCATAQGQYAAAEATYLDCFYEMTRMHGVAHRQTVSTQLNLGRTQRLRGNFDLAKANLSLCVDNYRDADVPEINYLCQYELGLVAYCTAKYDDAMSILQDSYATFALHFGPTAPKCCGVLLVWFLVQSEQLGDRAFSTVDSVDEFLSKFQAANAMTTNLWSNWKCLACFGVIRGNMAMCMDCPRLSCRLCQSCATQPKPSFEQCAHSDSSWKTFNPPVQYLFEQKLALLAQADDWDEYAIAANAYRAYCRECQIDTPYLLVEVKPKLRGNDTAGSSAVGGAVAVLVAVLVAGLTKYRFRTFVA